MENIEINFNDDRDEGLEKFARLVDPILINLFVERVKSTDNKKTIQELLEDWLEGR